MTEPAYLAEIRTSYDTVAEPYSALLRDGLDGIPVERAMLRVLADLVEAGGGGPVADVGCGPGHVTAYLHDLGLDVSGIDLSPGMIEVAGRDHPGLRFEVGSMTALALPDAGLAAVVAWWSIVHLPPEAMPVVFAEFHRVLTPGGHLLTGFHAGDKTTRKTEGYGGHPMSLNVHRLAPQHLTTVAEEAGLALVATLLHEPETEADAQQACLLFRKPQP